MDDFEVNTIARQMQTFSWVDYVVFVLMLAISAVVGVYWGFMKKQTTQSDYLLGGRNMKVIPVAMSLVASFVSGITLLGSPTEVYMHGTQYGYTMGGIFLMCVVMTQVYLPVFHDLKITSNYEYLSLRFNNKVRLFGSILFTINLIGWLPIVIYVPALAFNQVYGQYKMSLKVQGEALTAESRVLFLGTELISAADADKYYNNRGRHTRYYSHCVFNMRILHECLTAVPASYAIHVEPGLESVHHHHFVFMGANLDLGWEGMYYFGRIDSSNINRTSHKGGLQAVVWTDVIQISSMIGAMAVVAVKGTYDLGGFAVVWQRNYNSGRIEPPNWDPSPLARHTIWSLVLGGIFYWLQSNAVNQMMVQRYLALPTLRGAKWAVLIFCCGISLIYCFCLYCGLLIYAKFHDCDPLQTKLANAKDQLLPLLVMDVLGGIPGLSGVFVAGIFSAALSSLSTSLNSMSAVVLEDFYKPFNKTPLTDKQTNWLLKSVVIFLGALSLALVFVVEKMGTILQLTMTLESMTMGPQLGVFTLGILVPFVDSLGALIGGISGIVIMSWWCLSAQFAIARGLIVHPHKELSTEGCTYTYNMTQSAPITPLIIEEVNPILRVSYMWYTFAGFFVTILVGCAASQINRARGKPHIAPAPKLLAPQLRRFCKEPPHPADDLYINAFGCGKDPSPINTAPLNLKMIDDCEDIS